MDINIDQVFESFVKATRSDLVAKDGELTYGNFPDDFFDQPIFEFYENIKYGIIDEYEEEEGEEDCDLEDPNCTIDLNKKIDEIIFEELEKFKDDYLNDQDISINEIIDLFPEKLRLRVRSWLTVNLDEVFLFEFYTHKKKFSLESLKKLIDAGVQLFLLNTYLYIQDTNETMEQIEFYFNSIFSWTDKISFHLLFRTVMDLYMQCDMENIMYWVDLDAFSPTDTYQEYVESLLNRIIEKESKEPIPHGLFSEEVISKVKLLAEDLLSANLNLLKTRILLTNTFKTTLIEAGYRLFLFLAFFGFVNGMIPGIKQGAYSIGDLMRDLNDFYAFKKKEI